LRDDSVNPTALIGQETGGGGFKPDRNSFIVNNAMPHLDQTSAPVFRVDEAAAVMPTETFVFRLCRAVENFPLDAHFSHPLHSRIRLIDQ
jgi:hypothetical protein